MTSNHGNTPRLVIHGAGRMGQQLASLASRDGFELVAMVSRHHPGDGAAVPWCPGLDALVHKPDLLIDFSLPAGAVAAARWCADAGVPLISGTTGLDSTQDEALSEASTHVAVLHAANFSPGLNAMLAALAQLGHCLPGIEAVRITDVHHAQKKDAPSGTALALAGALLPLQAQMESRREGDIIGQHAVQLELSCETLSMSHSVTDRGVFARGALQAGRWLLEQPPGRYQALDWLGVQRG